MLSFDSRSLFGFFSGLLLGVVLFSPPPPRPPVDRTVKVVGSQRVSTTPLALESLRKEAEHWKEFHVYRRKLDTRSLKLFQRRLPTFQDSRYPLRWRRYLDALFLWLPQAFQADSTGQLWLRRESTEDFLLYATRIPAAVRRTSAFLVTAYQPFHMVRNPKKLERLLRESGLNSEVTLRGYEEMTHLRKESLRRLPEGIRKSDGGLYLVDRWKLLNWEKIETDIPYKDFGFFRTKILPRADQAEAPEVLLEYGASLLHGKDAIDLPCEDLTKYYGELFAQTFKQYPRIPEGNFGIAWDLVCGAADRIPCRQTFLKDHQEKLVALGCRPTHYDGDPKTH